MPGRSSDPPAADLRMLTLVMCALAGASLAAVVQLASRDQLSTPLLLSAACFAVAIPTSVVTILMLNYRVLERGPRGAGAEPDQPLWPPFRLLVVWRDTAYTACFGGFLGLFWSFHFVVGLIFLVMSALTLAMSLAAERASDRRRRAHPAAPAQALAPAGASASGEAPPADEAPQPIAS
jgi:hypothetical protein